MTQMRHHHSLHLSVGQHVSAMHPRTGIPQLHPKGRRHMTTLIPQPMDPATAHMMTLTMMLMQLTTSSTSSMMTIPRTLMRSTRDTPATHAHSKRPCHAAMPRSGPRCSLRRWLHTSAMAHGSSSNARQVYAQSITAGCSRPSGAQTAQSSDSRPDS